MTDPKEPKMKCRSCLDSKAEVFINMQTAVADTLNYFDYFNCCTQLGATMDDELPKTLCINCCHDLQTAYNFVQGAREVDTTLRLILSTRCGMAEGTQKVTLLEQATAPTEDYAQSQRDVLPTTTDPLADAELADEKPNVEELLQNILHIPAEQMKVECAGESESDDEPLANRLRNRSTSMQSASETMSGTDDETDTEYAPSRRTKRTCVTAANARNVCQFCKVSHAKRQALKKHLHQCHYSELTCEKCIKTFDYPEQLELHKDLVHSETTPMQCCYCPPETLIPREELSTHFRLKHHYRYVKYFPESKGRQRNTPTRFHCEICDRYFYSATTLADHVFRHTNDKPHECEYCARRFRNRRSYKAHQKTKHAEEKFNSRTPKPYKCDLCPKEFGNPRNCRMHKKSKHAAEYFEIEKPYQCEHCPKRYRNARGFRTHQKVDHADVANAKPAETVVEETVNEGPVECSYCKKQVTADKIKTHEARHRRNELNEKRFLCASCPRIFRNRMSLKSHEQKIHSEKPEPVECNICNKKVHPEYLPTHMAKVHTEERKFVCDLCGNAFKAWTNLYMHKRLHEKRNWECTICHKKYIRQFDLTIHMRSHTGERPFACHLCDKRFSVKVRLTYHLQKHSGIKHRCKQCEKEYVNLKGLRQHMYKHTGMPYRCRICKYACVLRDVFTKHLLRVHNTTMTDQELREMFRMHTGKMPRIQPLEETHNAEDKTNNSDHSNEEFLAL